MAAVATAAAANVRRGKANSGRSQKRKFSGVGRFSLTPSASQSRIIAGRTVDSASQHSSTPPPASIPSWATPGKSVSPAAKKAIAEVRALVKTPGPVLAVVATKRLAGRFRVPAQFQIAGDAIDAVVDAQSHEDGAERDAQHVDVPDRDGDESAGPDHGDHQRQHGHRRVPDAAEGHDQDRQHAQKRKDRGQRHRRLARVHLVELDDRQPGQPELRARMPRLDVGGQLAEGRDRFAVLGEVLLVLFGEFQHNQAQAAVVGARGGWRRSRPPAEC